MDEFKVRLRIKRFNKIVPIEGGRYLRSQQIADGFLVDVRTAVSEMPGMAGYAFVCWDDDGDTLTSVIQAAFSPYEERDIPRFVKHEVRRALDETDVDSDQDETQDDEE